MVFYICIIIIRVIEILICNSYHLHIIYFHEIFYKIVIFLKNFVKIKNHHSAIEVVVFGKDMS